MWYSIKVYAVEMPLLWWFVGLFLFNGDCRNTRSRVPFYQST